MLLFVVSIYASLLGPIPAVGGALVGALGGMRRYTLLIVAQAVTVVALGFRSSWIDPYAPMSTHIYFVSSHFCATLLWALFVGVVWRLIPEELPSYRRSRLRSRVKLDRENQDAGPHRGIL